MSKRIPGAWMEKYFRIINSERVQPGVYFSKKTGRVVVLLYDISFYDPIPGAKQCWRLLAKGTEDYGTLTPSLFKRNWVRVGDYE